ncbi:c-type cytochrome [Halopseudomonas salegens]|uniref:Cytochrome c556 n=1 Tax=Halopseudomonas salegens TaxID=1434072 RepID=A0A1H2HLN0_9GAMM|nr:cytochrome c [Halopseudomonas salegens]SDU32753.1 Cytochrome c556 [Halopseudomonas salegens]
MKTLIASLLGAAVLSASLTAQAQLPPEDQIKFRQAGYSFMSWNMGKIKAMAIDEAVEYDQQQILAAANAINGIAQSGMGALFGPGTEADVGDQATRVDPALFDNFPEVAELSKDFVAASDNLVEQAENGEQSDVRAAFAELGKSCKACHDKYRMD